MSSPKLNAFITQQERIPVGYIPTDAMAASRCQYLGYLWRDTSPDRHPPTVTLIGGSNGVPGTRTPLGLQILSFSCSFRQKNLQKNSNLGVGAPLGKILDPPLTLIDRDPPTVTLIDR